MDREISLTVKLREAGYIDTALKSIGKLEASSELAPDQKQSIAFEKGLVYKQLAAQSVSPDQQRNFYNQAKKAFQSFIDTQGGRGDHPLKGQAMTEMARIVLAEGQTLNWQAIVEEDKTTQKTALDQARAKIIEARALFQQAFSMADAEWKTFPAFIPEDDTKQRARRTFVEGELMRAKLDLAICTYEEAQSNLQDDNQHSRLLMDASQAFEKVHQEYRQQLAGLYARMMQAKCLQEQGDIRNALGIFDELLRTPTDMKNQTLMDFLGQVLQYRMICLNHASRGDYQFVVDEGTNWLNVDRRRGLTQIGLGIRWEMVRALEALGSSSARAEDKTEEKKIFTRRALAEAKDLARIPGRYQKLALRAESRLLEASDRGPAVVKEFSVAFTTLNDMLDRIARVQQQIEKAKLDKNAAEIGKFEAELANLLKEARDVGRIGLTLRKGNTKPEDYHLFQYRLSYLEFLSNSDWDSLALSEYLVRHAYQANPELRQDATYLAMASLARQFSSAQGFRRQYLLDQLQSLCGVAAKQWPEARRIIDAEMTLGTLLLQVQQPMQAVSWFAKVPKTSDRFGQAQAEAGQAYWQASILELSNDSSQVDTKEVESWQKKAREYLEGGIKILLVDSDPNDDPPNSLIRARISLAQLEVFQGKDLDAIRILTEAPFAVTEVVKKSDEQADDGNPLASLVYQLLLRAYVGSKQLDKARETRLELERVVGKEGNENLARIYTQLGRQLQQELEQKQQLGQKERADEIRASFEEFIGDLFKNRQTLELGGLIWISETYFSLASGNENKEKSKELFKNAAEGYQTILTRGQSTPDFLTATQKPAVQLRLLTTLGQLGDFQQAETFLKELLAGQPNQLEIQTAASTLYALWGKTTSDKAKMKQSITGDGPGGKLWGWNQIIVRLQTTLQTRGSSPEIQKPFEDAILNLLQASYDTAMMETNADNKNKLLRKTEANLKTLLRLSPEIGSSPQWSEFNSMYQQLLIAQKKPVEPLKKPRQGDQTIPETETADTKPAATSQPKTQAPVATTANATEETDNESNSITLWPALVLVALLIGGGVYFMKTSAGKSGGKGNRKKDLLGKYRR